MCEEREEGGGESKIELGKILTILVFIGVVFLFRISWEIGYFPAFNLGEIPTVILAVCFLGIVVVTAFFLIVVSPGAMLRLSHSKEMSRIFKRENLAEGEAQIPSKVSVTALTYFWILNGATGILYFVFPLVHWSDRRLLLFTCAIIIGLFIWARIVSVGIRNKEGSLLRKAKSNALGEAPDTVEIPSCKKKWTCPFCPVWWSKFNLAYFCKKIGTGRFLSELDVYVPIFSASALSCVSVILVFNFLHLDWIEQFRANWSDNLPTTIVLLVLVSLIGAGLCVTLAYYPMSRVKTALIASAVVLFALIILHPSGGPLLAKQLTRLGLGQMQVECIGVKEVEGVEYAPFLSPSAEGEKASKISLIKDCRLELAIGNAVLLSKEDKTTHSKDFLLLQREQIAFIGWPKKATPKAVSVNGGNGDDQQKP